MSAANTSANTQARDAITRAHFTARAATYAGAGDESLRTILDLAALQVGAAALDVATGTGLVLFALAQVIGDGGRVVGVDFTPAMLAQAAARRMHAATGDGPAASPARAAAGTAGAPSATPALVAAHASRLPFRDGAFDVATCRFSVHHFSDPEAGLAAMASALRPGGRLVIADFVLPDDPQEAEQYERLERLRGHQYVEIYRRERLERMLAGCGCPVRAVRTVTRDARPQDWLDGPNVAAESRSALAELVGQVSRTGGAGFDVEIVDGERRFRRTDLVLLGVKQR